MLTGSERYRSEGNTIEPNWDKQLIRLYHGIHVPANLKKAQLGIMPPKLYHTIGDNILHHAVLGDTSTRKDAYTTVA